MEHPHISSEGSTESDRTEERRIEQAYAKRQADDRRYSFFNQPYLFMVQQRERQLLRLLRQNGFNPLSTKRILEIGCGTGAWLREFIKWGAEPENIVGVDLLKDRVERAKQLSPDRLTVQCGSATRLDFPHSTFDLVFQFTVFTSILDSDMKRTIAAEMMRVVRNDGLIVWYDYRVNNPRNPDVKGVGKQEIRRLFPKCDIRLWRATLAPPVARCIAGRSWLLASLLERASLLCTHYIGLIRKSH